MSQQVLSEGYVREIYSHCVIIEVNFLLEGLLKPQRRQVPHNVFAPGTVIWPDAPIRVLGEVPGEDFTISVYVPEDDGELHLTHF